jgi:hypothetical protein
VEKRLFQTFEPLNIGNMLRYLFVLIPFCWFWMSCAQDSSKESGINAADAALWAKYKLESWKNHGCELVTDAELEQLFQFNGKETTLNARTLPNQAFCLRTWHKPDWKERETNNEKDGNNWLNPQNRVVVHLLDYTTEEQARMHMSNLRRDRRSTYEEDVTGIGEEAVWSTGTVTLLVRKGQYVINVCVEISDVAHENLDKAKAVATLAMRKL